MDTYFEGKSALVVDSNRDDLARLRELLGAFGMAPVATATSANMAISYLAAQSFDFCFAACDLGRHAKGGMQVIEEATLGGSRRFGDSFVLVAGAGQAQALGGSLNHAPDAIFTKPLESARLRACLEALARVKQRLRPLEACLDRGDRQGALEVEFADLDGDPDAAARAQRLRGLALLDLQRFPAAEALFAAQPPGCDWADIGLGTALYRQGRYREAGVCLARLTGQNKTAGEAFQLQARCERALGRWGEAQLLLRKATMLQPTKPQLQADLACLSVLGGDWQQAVVAYREALYHGRYSPLQRVDCYYGLVEALLQQVDGSRSELAGAAEGEAVRTLESAVRDFEGDAVVPFRCRLLAARLYRRSGNAGMAEPAARDAFERFGQLPPSEQAELADLLVDGLESSALAEAAAGCRQAAMRGLASLDWGRANLQAMLSYRKQAFDQAYGRFCEADRLRRGNPGVRLNLVQAGLEVAKRQPQRRLDVLVHCDEQLYDIPIGELSHRQQVRYRALCQRLGEMNRADGGV